jgi:S-DNA-T family DNA segregation ATPase FtsK/SpoIIIE
MCVALRWFRKLEGGTVLVPELLAWEEQPERTKIEFRPLPEQPASSWDAMADAFRRFVSGASVEWRESFGTLRVVVGHVRLPNLLSWDAHPAPEGRLVIGQRHGGGSLAIDASTTPHVLLSGATGSGKGGTIRAVAAAGLQGGWQLVVLDPKEAGEYAWLEQLGVPVARALQDQVGTLEHLAAVRRARQQVVRRQGADTWRDLPANTLGGWRPVLLIIDEAADLLAVTKGKSGEDRLRAALQQKAGELIAELARKGRSAGIHLLVAIQRAETAQLGDQGGALRNNLTARLALGSLDADGLRMLGISAADPVALALDGTPGRGICIGFAGDPRPSVCQVAWLDQSRARTEVAAAYPQGLGVIGPSPGGRRAESAVV